MRPSRNYISIAQLAYESAQLYKGSLIPLANQEFRVALTAYQSQKIDFPDSVGGLAGELRYSRQLSSKR